MFMVMKKEGGGTFAMLATVTFNISQYHDGAVMPGKTYTYMVHALKGNTSSDASNEVTITTP
jgi:hypothetical protein